MAIKWSPGCMCCTDTTPPSCEVLRKQLSTDGSTFNSTDWSHDAGPGDLTIEGIDHITIADATITPLYTMPSNAAYYVSFKIRGSSGSTPRAKLKMGANTADIDLSLETIKINSIGSRTLPTYDLDEWVTVNVYFCPTHSMAESAGQILGSAHTGYPDSSQFLYGMVTVDSANPTVTQAWTLEIIGTAEVAQIVYRPADVTYSGTTKTKDCGRGDYFVNQWEWLDQYIPGDNSVDNIDLTVTGTDITVSAPYTTRVWTPSSLIQSQTTWEPLDYAQFSQGPATAGGTTLYLLSTRSEKYDDTATSGFWKYRTPASNFSVNLQWYIKRDDPTSSVPYPEPTARKFIQLYRQSTISPFTLTLGNFTEDDHGNIPDPVPAFTVSVTDTGTTVEWSHPNV